LPHAPSSIAFPPAHPSLLAIATPTGSLQFYHIEARRLVPPTPQLYTLNSALRTQFTPLQSIAFEPVRGNTRASRMVIWSHDWLCSVQLDLEMIGHQAGRKGNAALPLSSVPEASLSAASSVNGDGMSGLPRHIRRKRAREAREALELVSLSGSSDQLSTPVDGGSVIGGGGSVRGSSAVPGHGWSSAKDPEFYKLQTDKFRGVAAVEWFGEGEMVVVERPFGDFVGELPPAFWSGRFGSS